MVATGDASGAVSRGPSALLTVGGGGRGSISGSGGGAEGAVQRQRSC